ncbi:MULTISPECIES: outer membrane beta-barrel protein [unclassified Chryseobacterium]|uniref:outer membrane beta-barrel protein n=1 Tax=unclassified Chryseobacterium TaxID=2593645 RepID=UPI000F450B08|nr:outer membrane beta-barrel protein [Chryseobacterium sp. G0240]ROI05589.1 porin family protein [Chryseobacterium sp. G0240]
MKKIVLMGAVALFGLSNAQIAKGTSYLSGQAGYYHNEKNEFETKRKDDVIRILPTAGYFVNTNLAVGLGVGYKSAVTKYKVGNADISNLLEIKDSDNAFVVAPFVRKYWTLSDKLYIFGQLQVPLEFGKEKMDANSNINGGDPLLAAAFERENNYTNIGVNIKPGLDYFLSKNWSIEATIGEFGYNTYKRDIDGARKADSYKFGISLTSVTFGVKYVFAK